MLHNRPKNGATGIDWASVSLARKHQRRVFHLGGGLLPRHAVYIRELSLADGALGCAMWDGGVVLTRIVYENAQVFRGARVLELGSGCGLTGLVCARFAESVVLTDYIVKVVENLEYNVALNSRNDDSDCDSGSDSDDDAVSYPSSVDSVPFRKHIASVIRVGPLDWDRVGEEGDGDATTTRQVACTAVAQSTRTSSQPWQHCATCFPSDPDCGCCVPCATSCHSGHTLGEVQHSRFRCDCYESDACHLSAPPNITLAPHSASVILGAELIYSLLAIDSLVRTISRFLSPDGIFYHLLSQDRDGVSAFVERMKQEGFIVESALVPGRFTEHLETRKWRHQSDEVYRLWSFRTSPDAPFPSPERILSNED